MALELSARELARDRQRPGDPGATTPSPLRDDDQGGPSSPYYLASSKHPKPAIRAMTRTSPSSTCPGSSASPQSHDSDHCLRAAVRMTTHQNTRPSHRHQRGRLGRSHAMPCSDKSVSPPARVPSDRGRSVIQQVASPRTTTNPSGPLSPLGSRPRSPSQGTSRCRCTRATWTQLLPDA